MKINLETIVKRFSCSFPCIPSLFATDKLGLMWHNLLHILWQTTNSSVLVCRSKIDRKTEPLFQFSFSFLLDILAGLAKHARFVHVNNPLNEHFNWHFRVSFVLPNISSKLFNDINLFLCHGQQSIEINFHSKQLIHLILFDFYSEICDFCAIHFKFSWINFSIILFFWKLFSCRFIKFLPIDKLVWILFNFEFKQNKFVFNSNAKCYCAYNVASSLVRFLSKFKFK